ncbi:MAG: TlpA family protein disulfide reductase [Bacteroidia bacterium]|nr:TlpA family protein disulfide reductase [Bacteroidia bacterium]
MMIKKKHILRATIIACAAFALSWYLINYKLAPTLPAYETKLINENGINISISDFKGNFVLISYFQTWCGSCIQEIPDIIELQNWAGNENLKVIFVTDEGIEKTEKFKLKFAPGLDFYQSAKSLKSTGVNVFPTTYLLDKEGNVIKSKLEGYNWNNEEVRELISKH